jgi:hypothetical protein
MTTAPTTTVEIERLTASGGLRHVYHAATRGIPDALRVIAQHAAAPVNPAVRLRIESESGGLIQIGQISASITVHH